jgi:hypothetical protein
MGGGTSKRVLRVDFKSLGAVRVINKPTVLRKSPGAAVLSVSEVAHEARR